MFATDEGTNSRKIIINFNVVLIIFVLTTLICYKGHMII